jgi:SAM-dependent methyltransferase
MLRTPEELRELTTSLALGTWTMTAIAGLFESGIAEHLREPRSIDELATRIPISRGRIEKCLRVATVAGIVVVDGTTYKLAESALPFSQDPMRTALTGELRMHLMQALHYLDSMRAREASTGWRHTNREILQSQGDASAALATMMKLRIAPKLDDLAARLEQPGARFLDVGVGVASVAIAMSRMYPNLETVGLDVYEPALALARENVARAKLESRVDLRSCAVEDLRDEDLFTLAWLPCFFVSNIDAAVARIHASLVPGGFIVCGLASSKADDRARAVWSLINEEWGGSQLTSTEAEAALTRAGFTDVRTLPGPDWAPSMVVGKR